MKLRQLLLRAMLWSLGLSALAGVLAVLLGGHDVIWRVAGTGAAAAIASGLLMVAARLVDREATRPAGLLAMGVVIAEFLLTLTLIWDVVPWNGPSMSAERVAFSAVAVALAGVPGVFFLFVLSRPGGEIAGRAGISLCGACFLVMLAGAWWPGSAWVFPGKWWSTASVLGGCGLPALAALAGTPLRLRPWRWLGVAASALATAMALAGVWLEMERGGKAFACVISLAAVLGYWNLALLAPLTAPQRWLRIVAMAAALVTAVLIVVRIIDAQGPFIGSIERIAGAAGIVAACGGLAVMVLARLNRRVEPRPAADLSEIVVICPRCRKQQAIHTGGAACGGCGLLIDIRLTEPRCATCGYLLYGLTSDRCPECGTLLAQSLRAQAMPT